MVGRYKFTDKAYKLAESDLEDVEGLSERSPDRPALKQDVDAARMRLGKIINIEYDRLRAQDEATKKALEKLKKEKLGMIEDGSDA